MPALVVREIDASRDPRWNEFVRSHPRGTAHLLAGWLRALRVECDQPQLHLACEDDAGALHGVLPLVATRGLPGRIGGRLADRRLSSLPRTPVGGPLTSSQVATDLLLDAAAAHALAQHRSLQIKRPCDDLRWTTGGLKPAPWRDAYVLQLPADRAQLRFGSSRNDARVRWAVRHAEAAGVRVRTASPDDLDRWYMLYLATMRRHVIPARPKRFFASILGTPDSGARLLVAERTGSGRARLIAGSVFVSTPASVAYAFNGVDRGHLDARPNDLLQWTAINDAVAAGATTYDLGEVTEDQSGLAEFKRKWGARPATMYRYYLDVPPRTAATDEGSADGTAVPNVTHVVQRVWRHVPLPLTRLAGHVLTSRL